MSDSSQSETVLRSVVSSMTAQHLMEEILAKRKLQSASRLPAAIAIDQALNLYEQIFNQKLGDKSNGSSPKSLIAAIDSDSEDDCIPV